MRFSGKLVSKRKRFFKLNANNIYNYNHNTQFARGQSNTTLENQPGWLMLLIWLMKLFLTHYFETDAIHSASE